MKTKKCVILSLICVGLIPTMVQGAVRTTESTQKKKPDATQPSFLDLLLAYEAFVGTPIKRTFAMPEDTLKGLKSIQVAIEELGPEAEKYGLTRESLQTDTELRLRKYGIKVVSEKQLSEQDAQRKELEDLLEEESPEFKKWWEQFNQLEQEWLERGILYAVVAVHVREGLPVAAYSISVNLRQVVVLSRSPTVSTVATTWQKGSFGSIGLMNVKDIRESVGEDVDRFINDYLAANPNQKAKGATANNGSPGQTQTTTSTRGLVSAIMTYNADNAAAFIDGQVRRVGDTIYGVKITNIYKDRVVFEKQDKESTLTWSQKVGEAPNPQWE